MAIINRVARLLKADLHAVIDHIEEPQLQLRQAIREMQEEVDRAEARLKHTHREITDLNEGKKNAEQSIRELNEEVELCLNNDNDELARGLLRKRLETNNYHQRIQAQLKLKNKAIAELESHQKEQIALLESMQQKADVLCEEQPSTAHSPYDSVISGGIKESDVEVALLKEKERLFAQKSAQ